MINYNENYFSNLDKQLKSDSYFIANLELSTLLLMNDINYPWLILVPRVNQVFDLIDLNFDDQQKLLFEINICGEFLKSNFAIDKLNIASLGNIVKQLHIHIIGRNKNDITFPKPVWGNANAVKYQENQALELIKKIQNYLATSNFSNYGK
jgi:diadenosine tetraphosphate (Ap4A) HIT family hydrolase